MAIVRYLVYVFGPSLSVSFDPEDRSLFIAAIRSITREH